MTVVVFLQKVAAARNRRQKPGRKNFRKSREICVWFRMMDFRPLSWQPEIKEVSPVYLKKIFCIVLIINCFSNWESDVKEIQVCSLYKRPIWNQNAWIPVLMFNFELSGFVSYFRFLGWWEPKVGKIHWSNQESRRCDTYYVCHQQKPPCDGQNCQL